MDKYWLEESGQYGVPFNPCIGIGKHQQVVEVQCQREYEGKGAHPNYIAKGVIDGFEEFKKSNIKKPYCLNQVIIPYLRVFGLGHVAVAGEVLISRMSFGSN